MLQLYDCNYLFFYPVNWLAQIRACLQILKFKSEKKVEFVWSILVPAWAESQVNVHAYYYKSDFYVDLKKNRFVVDRIPG